MARLTPEEKWSREARRLYQSMFGKPLPIRWRFEWNIRGMTIHHDDHLVILEGGLQTYDDYETLIHEFFHIRGFDHSPMYDEAVRLITNRVWQDVVSARRSKSSR